MPLDPTLVEQCEDIERWKACHADDSPGLMTLKRVFLILAKYWFSGRGSSAFPELKCLVGDDSFKIYTGTQLDPGDTENVPGILITAPEGVTFESPFLQAQVEYGSDYASEQNVYLGSTKIVFVCRHTDGDIAGLLADAVIAFLSASEQVIRSTYGWVLQYRIEGLTEPKRARKAQDQEAFEDWYEATATVYISYQYNSITRRESKRLQDFRVSPPKPLFLPDAY